MKIPYWVLNAMGALFLGTLQLYANELKDWENPRLTGISNEPSHATLIVCPDTKTALSIAYTANSQRTKSSFSRSLNGDWKYHYSRNLKERVPDFWRPEFKDSAW